MKVGCTLSQNGIGNGSNVQVLRRLRGGTGSYLDVPGQWECKVCHATRCWPARKRCYKCDVPRDTVPNNPRSLPPPSHGTFGEGASSVAKFWSSRHRDMLQGVLMRIREESEECGELGAQVARERALATATTLGEAIPLTQCDAQQERENDMVGQAASEEMYLSTVDEGSGDESMLLGTSTGAGDDLDVK